MSHNHHNANLHAFFSKLIVAMMIFVGLIALLQASGVIQINYSETNPETGQTLTKAL
jgi:hypothetical protein